LNHVDQFGLAQGDKKVPAHNAFPISASPAALIAMIRASRLMASVGSGSAAIKSDQIRSVRAPVSVIC